MRRKPWRIVLPAAVVTIHLPPLRERRSDIPLLARYFALREGYKTLPLSESAARFLSEYDWHGNVRELENAIQRALLLSRGNVITIDHLTPGNLVWDNRPAQFEPEQEQPENPRPEEGLDRALEQYGSGRA